MFTRKTKILSSSIVAAMSLAFLAGACASSRGKTEPAESPSAQKPAAELKRFYEQKLTFGSCNDYATTATEAKVFAVYKKAQCARLEVPLDYNDPNGRTAQIAVLRVPARGKSIGSLLLNPGGPGGSGIFVGAITGLTLAKSPVTERFDLIGFDPRGVGASTPAINCFTDKERDQGKDQTILLASSGEWSEDDTRKLMERCAQKSGGQQVLSAVSTRNTARDMDVLRAVVGDKKLTYIGQSYGTRLGAVYAEMFPQNVRAMVLDGVIDPTQGSAERRLSLHAGFQRSFDLMAASCAKKPNCPLGTDPKQSTAVFQKLVRPLIDNPVPAGNGRTLDFNKATGGVIDGLYVSSAWPRVIDGIAQLKNEGRGDKLLAIGDDFVGRDANGKWSNFIDANYAINCNDEQRRTPKEEADLRRKVAEVNPFVDSGQKFEGVTRDSCEFWPTEPTLGLPYADDVKGLPATLIISITGDPVTPYAAGTSLTKSLGGTMLTVEGEQHSVAMPGQSACVNKIVADYLIDLKLPKDNVRCVL
ncbi:alpha/beta hydrolase [Nostoc sp. CHAB 5784]|uniref:alpha/beta hydrolase n=1 Tax=Nostoc mirabile TaxID=2907820 RepID=UPI001E51A002|nr:alpha/beta hydrolase [Nostoc mirabile]MCC5669598.1 alpha/beta hydrolase [Nostoc mirabile CHAB5784]